MKEMADPKLARLLREYAEELRAAAPPANLEAALLAEFDARRSAKKPRKAWWFGAAGAVAAGLAVVMFTPAPIEPLPAIEATVPAPPVIAWAKPAAAPARKPILRNPRPVPRELVSEFVPLAENEFLPAPRQAQVYRVSVPRATLASLGFPVEEEADVDSRLTADVLMDQDGLARAVRLVKTVY